MFSGESPTTSLIARVAKEPAPPGGARWPPLIADTCRRTAFIAWIRAPEPRSSSVVRAMSVSVTRGTGTSTTAEPPPEMRNSRRSAGSADLTSRSRDLPAARLLGPGTGWLPQTTRTPVRGAGYPRGTATRPSTSRPATRTTASAIAEAAFPNPTTRSRPPRPGSNRRPATVTPRRVRRTVARTARPGSTARMPACRMARASEARGIAPLEGEPGLRHGRGSAGREAGGEHRPQRLLLRH